ncbi:MAG: cadherin-like domain-containing protein, partial [Rhodospirillales bacterium]|nr:cadherin-like domain-containing protein [Rhodospirillales bacterium]
MDSLNAAAAISAAAAALAKVNQAAATFRSTGKEVPDNLQEALALGGVFQTAAENVRHIIDAVVTASSAVITLAVQAAKDNPADAYNAALAVASGQMSVQVDVALDAKLGAGVLSYTDLSSILSGVKTAISTINALLISGDLDADLVSAVSDTFSAASDTVTAADETATLAFQAINEMDSTVVLARAASASTKATETQAHLKLADGHLVAYKLTAPIDAAFRDVLEALGGKVDDAQTAAVAADINIGGATEIRSLRKAYRAEFDSDNTNDASSLTQAVANAAAARAPLVQQDIDENKEADTAANAVLGARVVLVSALIADAGADKKLEALQDAVVQIDALVGSARSSQQTQEAITLGASNGINGTVTIDADGNVSYAITNGAFASLANGSSTTDTFVIATATGGDQAAAIEAFLAGAKDANGTEISLFTTSEIEVTISKDADGDLTVDTDLSAYTAFGATQAKAALQLVADADPTDEVAEARAVLAGRRLINETAELSFEGDLLTLFTDAKTDVVADVVTATSAAAAAQAAVDAAQVVVDNAEATFARELGEAILATKALADADSALAKAEGTLSLGRYASQVEAEARFDAAVTKAFAASKLAQSKAAEAREATEDALEAAGQDKTDDGVFLTPNKVSTEAAAVIAGGSWQEDVVVIKGSFAVGDVIRIVLNGATSTPFTYTIPAEVDSPADLETALVSAINASNLLNSTVVAIPEVEDGFDGVLKIRALTRPGTFDISITSNNSATVFNGVDQNGNPTSQVVPTLQSSSGLQQEAEAAAKAAATAASNVAKFANDQYLSTDQAAVASRVQDLAAVNAANASAKAAAAAAVTSGNLAWAASDLADVINPTDHDPETLKALLDQANTLDSAAAGVASQGNFVAAAAARLAAQKAIAQVQADFVTLKDATDAASEATDAHLLANGIVTATAVAGSGNEGKVSLKANVANVDLVVTLSGDSGALTNAARSSSSAPQIDTIAIASGAAAGSTLSLTVAAKQVDVVTVSGIGEAGDTYSVTVNGTTVTYTSVNTGTGGTVPPTEAGIQAGIIAAVNASGPIGGVVTAAAGKNLNEVTLTAKTAGVAFTSSATATDADGDLADNFALSYTEVANFVSTTVTYTVTGNEGGVSGIRNALVNTLNQSTALSGLRGTAASEAAKAVLAAAEAAAAEQSDDTGRGDTATDAAAAALAAAVRAETAATVVASAVEAAKTASREAAARADIAESAANGTTAGAARAAQRASNASASAALGFGSAKQSLSAADAQAQSARSSSNLQKAEIDAAEFADTANAEANEAAAAARADAQAAAAQARTDRAAAEDLAEAQATGLAVTAESKAAAALQAAAVAQAAARNVNSTAAVAAAEVARVAAEEAQSAAQTAIDAALGNGADALNQALRASRAASEASTSSGSAQASAQLASNALEAISKWVNGAASVARLAAQKAAAAAAATASLAAQSAATAATAAADARDDVLAPNLDLAAAQAAVTSRQKSLTEVTAKRAAADDNDDSEVSDIEAVWNAAITQATQALSDAQSAVAAAQSAVTAAESARDLAISTAVNAANAAAAAAAVAAETAEQFGFGVAFEIGAQASAQSSADAALENILTELNTAITEAETAVNTANAQITVIKAEVVEAIEIAAAIAGGDNSRAIDDTEALAASNAATAAANSAVAALASVISKLGLTPASDSVADRVAAIKAFAATAASIDDLTIDLNNPTVVKPPQTLIDAQNSANTAQNALVSSLNALANSVSQAITAAQAAASEAGDQYIVVTTARDNESALDQARIDAAVKALATAQATATAAENRADAAKAEADAAFEAATARASDAAAADLARTTAGTASDSASSAATAAQTAYNAASVALGQATVEAADALTAYNAVVSNLTIAGTNPVEYIDPAVFQAAQQANQKAQIAKTAATEAVQDAAEALQGAKEAATAAATAASAAETAASSVSTAIAGTAASDAATAAGADGALGYSDEAGRLAQLARDITVPGGATLSEVLQLVADAEGLAGQAAAQANLADASALVANQAFASIPVSIVIAGTVETGDRYSATINGTTVSITVSAGQSRADVRDALVDAINNNSVTGAAVTASSSAQTGRLTIVRDDADSILNISATTTNVAQGLKDNLIQVVTFKDARSNAQAAADAATAAAATASGVAQVDTLTISGDVAVGDVFTILVGADSVAVTVTSPTVHTVVIGGNTTTVNVTDGASVASVTTTVIEQLNIATDTVVASAGEGAGKIALTAADPGVPFIADASATGNSNAIVENSTENFSGTSKIAQIDTITLTGTVNIGDAYTITVDGNAVTITVNSATEHAVTVDGVTTNVVVSNGTTLATVANSFVSTFTTDTSAGAIVSAEASTTAGEFTLTSRTAGVAFSSGKAVNDSSSVTIEINPTVANLQGADDLAADAAADAVAQVAIAKTGADSAEAALAKSSVSLAAYRLSIETDEALAEAAATNIAKIASIAERAARETGSFANANPPDPDGARQAVVTAATNAPTGIPPGLGLTLTINPATDLPGAAAEAIAAISNAATAASTAARAALLEATTDLNLGVASNATVGTASAALTAEANRILADSNATSVAKNFATNALNTVANAKAVANNAAQSAQSANSSMSNATTQIDAADGNEEALAAANAQAVAAAVATANAAAEAAENAFDNAEDAARDALVEARDAVAASKTILTEALAFETKFSSSISGADGVMQAALDKATQALIDIDLILEPASLASEAGSATATAVNSIVTALNAVPQTTDLIITSGVESGDTIRVTIGTTDIDVLVNAGDSIPDIRNNIISAINSETVNGQAANAVVVAEAGFSVATIRITSVDVDPATTLTITASGADAGDITQISLVQSAVTALTSGLTTAGSVASDMQGLVTTAGNAVGLARAAATRAAADTVPGDAETEADTAQVQSGVAIGAAELARAKATQSEQASGQAEAGRDQFIQGVAKVKEETALALKQLEADAKPVAKADTASVDEGDPDVGSTINSNSVKINLLENDLRGDGSSLTDGIIASVGSAKGGTVTVNAQVVAIDVADGLAANDKFTVTINGQQYAYTVTGSETGGTDLNDSIRLSIVNAINSHPAAGGLVVASTTDGVDRIDFASATAGTPIKVTASYAVAAAPETQIDYAVNTAASVANGTVTYTTVGDFNGADTFTYTVQNSFTPPSFSSNTVTVTVNPLNDAPDAHSDFATTVSESAPVIIKALVNDTDVDKDVLSIANIGNLTITVLNAEVETYQGSGTAVPDANGTTTTITYAPNSSGTTYTFDLGVLKDNGNGTLTFTPNKVFAELGINQTKVISIDYTVTDGNATPLTDTSSMTITVTGTNDKPTITGTSGDPDDTPITLSITEDNVLSDTIQVSDPDSDSANFTFSVARAASSGKVTIDNTGAFQYTPNANFFGTDTFKIRVDDGSGGFTTQEVTVSVAADNDAPITKADTAEVDADGSVIVNILANDKDVEGDAIILDSISVTAGGGSVTILKQVIAIDVKNGLDTGDTVSVVIGGVTHTYVVGTDVSGADANAVRAALVTQINTDAGVTIASATDNVERIDFTATTAGEAIFVSMSGIDSSNGNVAFVHSVNNAASLANGNVKYTASGSEALGAGETESVILTYVLSDDKAPGSVPTSSSTLTIEVSGANDAPVAVTDDSAVVAADSFEIINVLANDTDSDNGQQVDLITLAGDLEEGDEYAVTVTINGVDYNVSYVVSGNEETLGDLQSDLISGLSSALSGRVTVTAGDTEGKIILTAANPGVSFTSEVTATDGGVITNNTATTETTTQGLSIL